MWFGHAVPQMRNRPNLKQEDPCYNSIQMLCFWAIHGDSQDGHEFWAPVTPKEAAETIVANMDGHGGKKSGIDLLNDLTALCNATMAESGVPKRDLAKVYQVKVETGGAGNRHSVETISRTSKTSMAIG